VIDCCVLLATGCINSKLATCSISSALRCYKGGRGERGERRKRGLSNKLLHAFNYIVVHTHTHVACHHEVGLIFICGIQLYMTMDKCDVGEFLTRQAKMKDRDIKRY